MTHLSNTTLIIPAHYRHSYLPGLLKYFSENSDIKILICDSTDVPFRGDLPGTCQYFHFPDMSFSKKMFLSLEKVKTAYVLMCADDDLVSPKALYECEQFLEKNNDYSSAQGETISFSKNEKGVLCSFPSRLYSLGGEISGETLVERVKQCFSHYKDLFYTVYSTEVLRMFFRDIKNLPAGFNGFLIEVAMAFYAIANGKNKALKTFYSAREFADKSWAYQIPNPAALSKSKKGTRDIDLIKNICTKHLLSKAYKEAEAVLAVDQFFENGVLMFETLSGSIFRRWRSKVFRMVEKLLPNLVERVLRKMLRAPSQFELFEQQVNQVRDLKGFPYGNDDCANEEWEKMKAILSERTFL